MKKTMIRIICFVALLACVLAGVNQVLKLKYGFGPDCVTTLYDQEKNSVDVLILGSSHAYCDFNTGVLWDEYGMAAYVLAGPSQPLWNSFYYLKEALKTQRPELIVLEGYCLLSEPGEYDKGTIILNTSGLKWSVDKMEAIKVSTPQEHWRDHLPEYVQYHTRYRELSSADFLKYQGNSFYENWKGFRDFMDTEQLDNPDVPVGINEKIQIHEKTEKYYRMIIELAQENDIPIVVIVSPYAVISENVLAYFNWSQDIAAEYGVEFVNYNLCYREIGIDYTTDALDGSHLNFRGNRKFSTAVGQYLVEHYDISDRRGDSRYQSWQEGADYIRANLVDHELCGTEDREVFLEKVKNGDYLFFISTDGECDIKNKNIHRILNVFGISYNGTNEIWKVSADGMEWYSGEQEAEHYRRIDQHDIFLRRIWSEEDEGYKNEIFVDAVPYKKVEDGVNVTVYSTVTKQVVDSVGFDAHDDYQLVR